MKYEDFIRDYVKENAEVLNKKAVGKRTLLKFSEAVSRAISDSKKSDTGYGNTAELLANAGLSSSGYADYIKSRARLGFKEKLDMAEDEKREAELIGDIEYREEEERLKKEALMKEEREKEALEKEKEKLNKLIKTVQSFASVNDVEDYEKLYRYALSLGLPEDIAKEVSEESTMRVREEIRGKNIDKARSVIVSERLTKDQAYQYAKSLGLSTEDAEMLAEFAYKMNQDTSSITGKEEKEKPTGQKTGGGRKKFEKIQLN